MPKHGGIRVFADLSGLPPVFIVVGADDVLLDDNLAMAARFVAAGVQVELRVYPASPHAFTGHATSMARVALEGIDDRLQPVLLAGQGDARAGLSAPA